MLTTKKPKTFPANLLAEMRLQGDSIADAVIQSIFEDGDSAKISGLMRALQNNQTESFAELPLLVQDYFRTNSQLPSWADAKRMAKGVSFFEQYAQEILSMLGFLSLPYCYAGADGAQVLYLSERIRKDTTRRLIETAQFVIDVMQRNAFEVDGKGLVNTLKVRLMHAAIRFHILKSNQWNMDWGLPVNQEDMAGTNLAFSWICVRGLKKIGYSLDNQAVEDFLHLWNVIGYVMGVDERVLPQNGKEAFWLDKRIVERNFKTSEAGINLTQSLLISLNQNPNLPFPKGFPETYMRFLLGDEIANLLDVPKSNWTANLLTPLQLRNQIIGFFPKKSNPFLQQVRTQIQKENVQFEIPLKLK